MNNGAHSLLSTGEDRHELQMAPMLRVVPRGPQVQRNCSWTWSLPTYLRLLHERQREGLVCSRIRAWGRGVLCRASILRRGPSFLDTSVPDPGLAI